MKRPLKAQKLILQILYAVALIAALGLAHTVAIAGTFSSDFSNPNQTGFTLNGGIRPDGVTPYPAIENGHLALTYTEYSEQASIVIDDLDGGAVIESFTMTFKMQIGPGSANPADGVAVSVGPDVNSASNFGEEGTGNGIIVSFDTYDNGGNEAPAIDVKYGGNTIAHTSYSKADMVTSQFEDVSIQLKSDGTLSVTWKGIQVYQNLLLPGFAPSAGQFAIGARTGGENENHWIDDLNITTGEDSDGDGVPNSQDQCPNSDLKATVNVLNCNSGVPNLIGGQQVNVNGCSLADLVAQTVSNAAAQNPKNHGKFVSAVAKALNNLVASGLITWAQHEALMNCVAASK